MILNNFINIRLLTILIDLFVHVLWYNNLYLTLLLYFLKKLCCILFYSTYAHVRIIGFILFSSIIFCLVYKLKFLLDLSYAISLCFRCKVRDIFKTFFPFSNMYKFFYFRNYFKLLSLSKEIKYMYIYIYFVLTNKYIYYEKFLISSSSSSKNCI